MASWLRYISREDYVRARAMAESNDLEGLRLLAVRHVRREDRFSYTFIPLSVLFAFLVALSLYAPGLYPDRLTGGFMAIGAMFVPVLVLLSGQRVQQEGRIIALAYYIREYMEERRPMAHGKGISSDTA